MMLRVWSSLAAVGLGALLLTGCDSKKSTNAGANRNAGPASTRGSEAQTLAPVEAKQDLETIRNALAGLENLASAGERPVWTDADRAELTKLLRLSDAESADLVQRAFSPADAAYIEECLLIRMGLRSVAPDRLEPAVRARSAFDWVCRSVYIDSRVPWPAPPWQTLQSGSGVALSRAYAVLAAWRQVGVDGCLIGPANLLDTPSMQPLPDGQPRLANVRLCGARLGKEIVLFDHTAGKVVLAADKKTPLTLAQAKATPALVASIAAESEVATWKPFLAPSIQGLSRRMEWLEQLSPANCGARLFVNVRAEREQFIKDAGDVAIWCVPGDSTNPGRIIAKYQEEEGDEMQRVSLRVRHRVLMVPREYLPETALEGNAKAMVTMSFARWFENLRYTPGTPRDLQLRGNYKEALSALDETSNQISNARQRIEQDRGLRKDFDRFVDELQSLTAEFYRVKGVDPSAAATAQKRIETFQSTPRNIDIERSFVLGTAARPLGAEVMFLTAMAVHERCERMEAEGAGSASAWQNAIDCWDRFLSVAANTRASFPGREPHAKLMKARCLELMKK